LRPPTGFPDEGDTRTVTTTNAPAPKTAVGFRSERGPVLAALMMSTGLVALDSTIIATAVPSVVSDLGGFSQFPWLFSIYLLTQAVSVPLYGKFADVVGRRPVMFFGIGIFVLGSLLCGIAWSMPALIVARAIQGLGAGAVQPMAITMVGDMYTVEERARVQGYVASVWGIAAVIGPALGGVFAQYLSWRWIFLINLPLGALAAWMLARHFHERVERRTHRMDYAGATLLTLGCSAVIFGLLEGGVAWDWVSAPSIAIFAAGVVLLVAFVFVEQRAAEPILPLWVFRHRTLNGGNLTALAVGALMMGLSSYVPTYVQGVLGTGPVLAGFALAALTIGWPIAATLSGRVYMRIGFRDTALIGTTVVMAGTVLGGLLGADSAVWTVAAACFVVGIGLGFSSSPTVVAVQSVVGWDRRGVVTGTNMFARSVGSAVGVAVFGAIANATLADRFADAPAGVGGGTVDATASALDSNATGPLAEFARNALYDASHHVFLALIAVAALAVVAILLMPRRTTTLEFD
jgi:EmrB/QacA subfamily drug resistance transporter